MTALTLVVLIMITRCPSAITIRQLGRKKNLLLKELTPYLACTKHSRGCTARAWVQREHKLRAWGSFFIGVKSWESKVSQAHFFIGEFKAREERERKGEKRALNGQLLSQPRSLHKGALGRGGTQVVLCSWSSPVANKLSLKWCHFGVVAWAVKT